MGCAVLVSCCTLSNAACAARNTRPATQMADANVAAAPAAVLCVCCCPALAPSQPSSTHPLPPKKHLALVNSTFVAKKAVREAKKAAKRERREAERRAALEEAAAAASAPLSPRNAATRARFGSVAGRASWREGRAMGGGGGTSGEWLVGSEDMEEAEGGGGGAALRGEPGAAGGGGWDGEGGGGGPAGSEMSGGSMGGAECEPADAVLLDPLSAR